MLIITRDNIKEAEMPEIFRIPEMESLYSVSKYQKLFDDSQENICEVFDESIKENPELKAAAIKALAKKQTLFILAIPSEDKHLIGFRLAKEIPSDVKSDPDYKKVKKQSDEENKFCCIYQIENFVGIPLLPSCYIFSVPLNLETNVSTIAP